MNTLSLLKLLMVIGTVAGFNSAHANVLVANAPEADIAQYEQTYEDWVQTLIQGVAPKNPATVLLKFDYGTNPDQVQTYEEIKASNHLPGLPDISDPHATHPYESAISALVSRQKIKVIFENALPAQKKQLLNEILSAKLHLNKARGDEVVFEELTPAEVKAPVEATPFSRQNAAAGLLAAIVIMAMLSVRKKTSVKTETFAKPFKIELENTPAVLASPVTTAAVAAMPVAETKIAPSVPKVQSLNLILKGAPKVLHQVLRSEKTETLARAFMHTPTAVSGALLNVCTPEQRKEILSFWSEKAISPEQSRFSQLLIAARIQQETEKQATSHLAVFAQIHLNREQEKITLAQAETKLREVLEVKKLRSAPESFTTESTKKITKEFTIEFETAPTTHHTEVFEVQFEANV